MCLCVLGKVYEYFRLCLLFCNEKSRCDIMCAWVVRVCVHLMLWNVCFVTTERRRTETCWWALRCWKLYRFSFLNIPKRLLLSLYCQFAFIFVFGALNVYSNSSRCRAHICSTAQRAFSVNIFGLWRDIDTHKIQSERTNEKLKKERMNPSKWEREIEIIATDVDAPSQQRWWY